MIPLIVISILGICLIIAEIKSVQISETPILACSVIIGTLYIFSLLNALSIIVYVLLLTGILCIPYLVWRNRESLKDYIRLLINPGFIYFLFSSIALYFITQPMVTAAWDEYSHWALIVKNLLYYNELPQVGSAVTFIQYPPGTALFQYWFMLGSQGGENILYYAHSVLIAACLSAFLSKQSFKKPYPLIIMILAPLAAQIKFSVHNIFNIFPDALMVLMSAACIIIYTSNPKSPSRYIKLIPILFALSLIRPSSIWFGLITIIVIMAYDRFLDNTPFRSMWKPFSTLFSPLLLGIGSWKLHLAIIGYQSPPSKFFPFDNEKLWVSTKQFILSFLNKPVGNTNPQLSILSKLSTPLLLSIGLCLLVILIAVLLKNHRHECKRFVQANAIIATGFAVYCIGLLIAYQTSFTKYEAETIASFNRYISTYFMFWSICIVYLIVRLITSIPSMRIPKFKRVVLHAIPVIIILALIGLSHPSKVNIFSSRQMDNPSHDKAQAHARVVQDAIGHEAKVYLIFQKSSGPIFMSTRYELGTNPTNLGTWSLGEKYSENDIRTVDLSPDEFIQRLYALDYQYVYIGYGDEPFWTRYGELFDQQISGGIYRVTHDTNTPLQLLLE